jgi:carbamoyl-phosphate synthase large subunit
LNILITSAGRRTSLVVAFQEAARPWGHKVLATDLDPLAPACALADGAFCLPRVKDASYLTSLRRLVQEQDVGLIIPTIDTELPILARHSTTFLALGAWVAAATPEFVAICRDKWQSYLAFQAEGVAVPASWLPDSAHAGLPDQVFLKPRDGSASCNCYCCPQADIGRILPLVPNPIIQECLDGPEVTIDAFLDFQGRPIHFVPRERIRTLGGESIEGVTLDLPDLDAWAEFLLGVCARLGARGPLTIQAFLTDRGPVLTEINARFGGGFPLARAAGGDYPAWILALRRGETLEPKLGEYRRGLYMTRYHTEIFMDSLPWPLTRDRGAAPAKAAQ